MTITLGSIFITLSRQSVEEDDQLSKWIITIKVKFIARILVAVRGLNGKSI